MQAGRLLLPAAPAALTYPALQTPLPIVSPPPGSYHPPPAHGSSELISWLQCQVLDVKTK